MVMNNLSLFRTPLPLNVKITTINLATQMIRLIMAERCFSIHNDKFVKITQKGKKFQMIIVKKSVYQNVNMVRLNTTDTH